MTATRSGATGEATGGTAGPPLLLADLMPWSVPPLRLGRSWVLAPDAASLTARWDRLVRAEGAERDALFVPTRARTQHTPVASLPGTATATARFAREDGPCPPPLRVAHGPFDEQWLIPDHRLIDAARPELWRVADGPQVFSVEQAFALPAGGPAVLAGPLLPVAPPTGRPGRVRPLYRRPGGAEPNLSPGLCDTLSGWYGVPVTAPDVLAWVLAAGVASPAGCTVPLPAARELWSSGVDLGRLMLSVQAPGALGAERPRLPGGRRPYVRAALPARPDGLSYDEGGEALLVGEGRIAPVSRLAWNARVGSARMLETWFALRTAAPGPGTLDAVRPAAWPPAWTSDLLDLITVLTLLGELSPYCDALRAGLDAGPIRSRADLAAAGVLPVPAAARRPASVLDHQEEGPDGQFALL